MSELRKDYYVPDKYVLIPNNFDQLKKIPEVFYKEPKSDVLSDLQECPYCPHTSQKL